MRASYNVPAPPAPVWVSEVKYWNGRSLPWRVSSFLTSAPPRLGARPPRCCPDVAPSLIICTERIKCKEPCIIHRHAHTDTNSLQLEEEEGLITDRRELNCWREQLYSSSRRWRWRRRCLGEGGGRRGARDTTNPPQVITFLAARFCFLSPIDKNIRVEKREKRRRRWERNC